MIKVNKLVDGNSTNLSSAPGSFFLCTSFTCCGATRNDKVASVDSKNNEDISETFVFLLDLPVCFSLSEV